MWDSNYCQCHRQKYRRNIDDALRQVERRYQANRDDEEAYQAYRTARIRAGLPVPTFEYGYTAGVPLDVETAWGARTNLVPSTSHQSLNSDPISFDVVWDRTSWYPVVDYPIIAETKVRFPDGVIDDLRRQAQKQVKLLRRYGELRNDERQEHLLAEKDDYVMLGNTNASHGYLYICIFKKPPGWVGPNKWTPPPPPPPPPPLPPDSAIRAYRNVLGSVGVFRFENTQKLTPEDIPLLLRQARESLTNKTGAKTPKAFTAWLLKQKLTEETKKAILARRR